MSDTMQVMLGKDDPGEPIKINCIWRIQLICAAMNMGFRIIWGHEMMKHATWHGLLSPYQFGGVSSHMFISCILLKWTSYDIIWLMQLIVVVLDNDAKAAYDQMIPSQCMITSARAGVPKGAIKLKLTALKQMKYFVKTAYGSSSDYFMNTFLCLILRLLQGSVAVGSIWALNSSIQLDVLDHTPASMAKVIMTALDQWFSNLPPELVPHLPTRPDDPNQQLHHLINDAFVHQNYIGWGHFLWGCLSLHWKQCIASWILQGPPTRRQVQS